VSGSTRSWLFLAAGGVVFAAAVGWAATVLPADRVPLHFGPEGVDRIGSRTEAVVGLGAVGGGLLVLGALIVGLAPRRRPRTGRETAAAVAPILGATLVFLSFVPVLIVSEAPGADLSLPPVLPWALLAGGGLALFGWAVRSARDRVV
jgi:hypothetical protein